MIDKEILDTLNELSKKPITELAMSYMEVVVDNIVKDKEIARLNNIIDELEKWNNEKSKGRLERTPYDEVNIKLQELKKEGKE